MSAAWRKRAEEAEYEVAKLTDTLMVLATKKLDNEN